METWRSRLPCCSFRRPRPPSALQVLLLSLSPCLLLLLGCGKSGGTVTGKVSYRGHAVTYGSVIFVSTDGTTQSGGIESDGSYTVKRVVPGSAKIGVVARDPAKRRVMLDASHQASRAEKAAAMKRHSDESWFPLPRKFEDPDKSGLSCTVAGGRVVHNIDLK
jgi:hypothetical protein